DLSMTAAPGSPALSGALHLRALRDMSLSSLELPRLLFRPAECASVASTLDTAGRTASLALRDAVVQVGWEPPGYSGWAASALADSPSYPVRILGVRLGTQDRPLVVKKGQAVAFNFRISL